jgi:hypothetical protein
MGFATLPGGALLARSIRVMPQPIPPMLDLGENSVLEIMRIEKSTSAAMGGPQFHGVDFGVFKPLNQRTRSSHGRTFKGRAKVDQRALIRFDRWQKPVN